MNEHELRALIEEVRSGEISRRSFVQRMVALGLTAPMASAMLMHSGVAQAQAASTYKPTKRGGGGALRVLWWQGATLLNPHFATGTKDQEGSRIFYEPLAAWDADGVLVPVLAAEIPTAANGGLSKDGKSVTWKLKRGVTWHDGKPFTADDCVFNWEYAKDPGTAAVTVSSYSNVVVKKIDSHTVEVTYSKPTPFWADPFVGTRGMLIPKHLFGDFIGAKSRDAPANLKPVGTGPYKFVDFKPGDMVRGEINTNYHVANRPYFDTIEMKGGGDAVSAARAVIQTGEYDYAWNVQVEDEILKRLEVGGKGRAAITPGGNIEFIQLNQADPWTEVDGERANPKSNTRSSATRRCARRWRCWSTARACRISSTAAPAWPPATSSTTRRRSAARTRSGSSTSTRRTPCSKPRAGRKAPTVSAKKAARSEARLPDLDQRATPEDAGDRQAGVPEGRHRP